MEKPEVTVRPARREDVDDTALMLARAFEDDPTVGHLLPRASSRRRRLRRFFATLLRKEALRLGSTEVALVDGRTAGAAIWKPPKQWLPPLGVRLATLPGYLSCYQLSMLRAISVESVMIAEHPRDEPHWYLQGIGTEPNLQGKGVGTALLRSQLARVDEEGFAAYLESSNPANVPLYEHFGFEVTGILGLPEGSPQVTKMWRPAQR